MKEHSELQTDLAAYMADRLETGARERLEAHLKECEPCREMASVVAEFGRTLQEGGEVLFEAHPAPSSLRSFAQGVATAGETTVARHVKHCASCALEVEGWKRAKDRGRKEPAARAASGKRAFLLAAGVVLGLGLAALARWALIVPAQRPGLTVSAATAGPILILPGALRGAGERVSYAPDRKAEFVVMACPVEVPGDTAAEQTFVYAIRASDGKVAWSQTLTAGSIREHLASPAAMVALLVPVASVGPGRYEFTLSRSSEPEQPLYQVGLEISAGR